MRRYRLIFLFIIFTNQLYTQVNYCNINQNDTNICIGNSLILSASVDICQNYSNLLNLSDKSIKAVYEINDTIYIAGIFTGMLNIGSYSFISYGMQDIFIAKLNSCSEVIWANHIGSSNDDDVTELYVQNNNLFVSGSYWNSTLSINHINGTNTIPNNGKLDGFLINFNIYNGSHNWDISVRANSNESCRDVTLDDFGNIYLVGSFNGCCPSSFSAMVYSSNNTSLSLTTNSYSSGYLVKIDASGTPLWSTIGYNRDFDNTTVTSLNGDIYVGSNFRSWNFGTSATIHANNGTFSIYNPGIGLSCLIKYDTNGNLMWSRSIGNSGSGVGGATHINDLISNQGRISVTGTYYAGGCIFYENTGSIQSSLNSAEGVDGFYGEYNEDGSLNFSYRISGLDDEIPKRIYQNSDSTCIISGYYNNNIFYNGQTISSNGLFDMFITEINTSSYMSYLDSYGGILDDYIFAFDLYDNNQTSIFGGEIYSGAIINNDTANFNGGFIYNSNQISNTLLWSTGDTSASIVINPTQTNTYWLQSLYNGGVICSDSIIVTVHTDTFFNNILVCGSYIWDGVMYTNSGVYYNTYINSVGCDSTVVLNLTVDQEDTSYVNITACDSLSWNDSVYTQSGTYFYNNIDTNSNNYSMYFDGVDDYIHSAHTLLPSSEFSISFWIKTNNQYGQVFYNGLSNSQQWGQFGFLIDINAQGKLYTSFSSNSFNLIENYTGNTSLNDNMWHNVNITYNNGVLKYYVDGSLDGQFISSASSLVINSGNETKLGIGVNNSYPFGGLIDEFQIWTVELSQQEIQNYISCPASGSESDLRYYLKFEEGSGSLFEQTQNGFNQNVIHGATWDMDTPDQSCNEGCDSTAILNLIIVNSNTGLSTATACDLYNWNGLTYTTSGIYTQTLLNMVGCDSIHTLDLTINSSSQTSSSVTSCDSYIWDGVIYMNSGIYINTYTNIFGCDSTHTLNLTINSSDQTSSLITSCDYYIWNGLTYTTSGTYTQTMLNTVGCDSIHTLNLTIVNSNTGLSTATACDSYNWNGLTYTTSGIYTQTIVNMVGCDSIHTLDLTINSSNQTSSSVTSCDSFIWDGITYTTSGVYMHIYTNSLGCDSIHTLNLTINNTDQILSTVVACNSYTWGGVTYTVSGIYTNIYTNIAGCDSVHTLDLTINYSSQTSSSILACDSHIWDGITYTTTGVYMHIYINSSGCDSIHTLNLTINNTDQTYSSVTACNSYTWDGETYITSGTHTNVYTNIGGCDSTHTLDLIINYSDTIYNQYNICYGDSIVIGDSTYYTTGNFINIFTASNGCDSIIFDNINVDSQLVVLITQIDSNILANVSGGIEPYSYQWNTGEDSSQISITNNSSYWVIVLDSNNCISDTAFYKPNEISNTYITDLLIFPNPSKNIFYIEFYNKANQEIGLNVIDNIGRKIYNKGLFVSQGTVKTHLNLYNIRRGIYYLQIKIGEELLYKKLILQ